MKKYILLLLLLSAAAFTSCAGDREWDAFEEIKEEMVETEPPETVDISRYTDLFDYDHSDTETSAIDYEGFDDAYFDDLFSDDEDAEENGEVTEDGGDKDDADKKDEEKSKDNDKKNDEKKDDKKDDKKSGDSEVKEEKKEPESKPKEKDKPDAKAANCIDVPYISQDAFPTGCELVSTSMLLKYYGVDLSAGDFLEKYMSKAEFKEEKGKLYGGDPNEAYIGDPTKDSGYGCYGGAIIKGLEKLFKDDFYDIVDLRGMSLDDVCSMYVGFGEPVLIWASIDMMELEYVDESKWIIEKTGKEFKWLANEHCLVLVGFDDEYYYFNDPLKGKAYPYSRRTVDERYEKLGCQAVTFRPW